MVLVTVGTAKHEPSRRITEVDPRGGAAVIGDNGVGKTTAFRLLPLFFGHLPQQISSDPGQDPMVSHVLPNFRCAIDFEYQRGSDAPEDLRIAVVRRRADGADVPEYRIYKTASSAATSLATRAFSTTSRPRLECGRRASRAPRSSRRRSTARSSCACVRLPGTQRSCGA